MRPVCFMVMPFRKKPVTNAREGAPKELNCDRLWDAVFRPLLEDLGYLPVRADIESTSVIVKDMLNRLAYADLVLADVSLPNGNVYYELGIRHVAKETRCVQVAAEWFQPLFDIKQFRTITYPLHDGEVPDAEAVAIRSVLADAIPSFGESRTPYHELIDANAEQAFEAEARRIGAFQAEISAVRLLPKGAERTERVEALVRDHGTTAGIVPGVALELLYLVRDTQGWAAVRDFVDSLPESTRQSETIQEQYLLALSKLGDHEVAIGHLEQLNQMLGATPERLGLIGGRYKRLYRGARQRREDAGEERPSTAERQYLKRAIESYEQGMVLDLNEYYCACNLPALLRDRARHGDEERAVAIDNQVVTACRRAKQLGSTDPWLEQTLFGAAFRSGDVGALDEIADEIEGGAAWQLGTTLDDAETWIRQAPEDKKAELDEILQRLRGAHQEKSGT